MAESAALLVDAVFPCQPVRQWVLSFLFSGRRTDDEGVKLEQQIVVRDSGPELLTHYPLDLV